MLDIISLNYLSLIHYRKSLFKLLNNEEKYRFHFIAGEISPYPNMKNFLPDEDFNYKFIKNNIYEIGPFKFIWQKDIIRKTLETNPSIVILLGVNPLILSSLYAFFSFKKRNIKVYWWGHGTLGHQGSLGVTLRKWFYKNADGVLLYDERGKKNLLDIGIPSEKLKVISNCINHEDYGFNKYSEGDIFRNRNKELTILFSGRITYSKRLDKLIEAINLIKLKDLNVKAYIIGDGPELNNCIKLSSKYNLESNIYFLGSKYGLEIDKYFLKSNIFVLPGAVGLSIIHCLSYGLPIITTDNLEIQKPEIAALKQGVNGGYFKDSSINDLAMSIIFWHSKYLENPVLTIRSCINSLNSFTPEYVKKQIEDFIL